MEETLFNRGVRGFTLIEFLITIAIAGILLAIVSPSFSRLIDSNKLSSARDLMISSLQTAQQQALTKNISTYFCPTKDGSTCETSWATSTDWLAFEDLDRDSTLDSGEIFLVQQDSGATSISNTTSLIQFRPTGHVVGTTSFTICISSDISGALITIGTLGDIAHGKVGGC